MGKNKKEKPETVEVKPAKQQLQPKPTVIKLPRVGILNTRNMNLNATYKGKTILVSPGKRLVKQFDRNYLKLDRGLKLV